MNNTREKIFFLAASDRLNYGDLLFPIIFKKIFENERYSLEIVATVDSCLTEFGALPTKSLKSLDKVFEDADAPINVVVGGGQVFFSSYTDIYSYISPFFSFLIKSDFIKRLLVRFKVAEKIVSSKHAPLPFIVEPNKNVNVFYNAAGGGELHYFNKTMQDRIKKSLKSAKLVSVRDTWSKGLLHSSDIQASLVPDSALIMSDLFTKEFLNENHSKDFMSKEPYILVQLGVSKGPVDMASFAEILEKIRTSLGIKRIVCCPIGLAPGHEDNKILQELVSILPDSQLFMPTNLFQIMSSIAHAKLFMGTSLHGVITSYSFQVPFIALNTDIKKIDAYIKSWMTDFSSGSCDFYDFEKMIELINSWDENKVNELLSEQKKLVYKNFELIKEQVT